MKPGRRCMNGPFVAMTAERRSYVRGDLDPKSLGELISRYSLAIHHSLIADR